MIGDRTGQTSAEELRAERERLLAGLREIEIERDAGELPEGDYAALRDDYTGRAAALQAELEGLEGGAAEVDAAPETAPAEGDAVDPTGRPLRRRRLRVSLVVAGLVSVGIGAGLLVSAASGSRQAGQTVSGSVPPSASQELVAARQAMSTGNDTVALELYHAVLQAEPNQPEALAYSGWLLRLSGDATNQRDLINEAVAAERAAEAADPSYPDPHFFLGVILLDDLHDPVAAVPQLQAYLGTHPSAAVQAAVGPVLARAQQEAAQVSGASARTTSP